ncbi:MAG: hypothetical protein HFI35_11470 [Roseburia sp.]|nr:hypothetical protein [Roseburia sp.]
MKKITSMIGIIIFLFLITSCNHKDVEDISADTTQQVEETKNQHIESQEIIETDSLCWPEITEDGVNEELYLEHLDAEVLEAVATKLRSLVEEEVEAERENPEIVITEGWTRVFDSQQYNEVLNMGESAMKPLYWIIYKSPNAGMYEYICAAALYELSGYDFTNEDGSLTWVNSKEFLDRFNEKILSDRKHRHFCFAWCCR